MPTPAPQWLLKTEPSEYSLQDLLQDGQTLWDGVRNAEACKNLRSMCPGDGVLIYHTGEVRAIVGQAVVLKIDLPEPGDPDLKTIQIGKAVAWKEPLSLARIKADPALADWALVRQGRLSVVPIGNAQWNQIKMLANI